MSSQLFVLTLALASAFGYILPPDEPGFDLIYLDDNEVAQLCQSVPIDLDLNPGPCLQVQNILKALLCPQLQTDAAILNPCIVQWAMNMLRKMRNPKFSESDDWKTIFQYLASSGKKNKKLFLAESNIGSIQRKTPIKQEWQIIPVA